LLPLGTRKGYHHEFITHWEVVMPFVSPPPIFIPRFRVDLDFLGIANSVDPATRAPMDFRPTGLVQAETEWTGLLTMTAPVEVEEPITFISTNTDVLIVSPQLQVPAGGNWFTFTQRAGSVPVGSIKVVVVAIYTTFAGLPSTKAMQIEVFSRSIVPHA
jgi:hypothetical protein